MDNTQAFYDKPVSGIDTFYTCRKFFGVPDGAYLYTDQLLDVEFEQDESYERMTFLLKRIDIGAEEGYADFRRMEDGLDNQSIMIMSYLTERLMQSIDYETVAIQRKENFYNLHKFLADSNKLHLTIELDTVPMVYPYLTDNYSLRGKLLQSKVFVANYWPNVLKWVAKNTFENELACHLIPLPIDQRYSVRDMNEIIELINRNEHIR